MFCVRVFLYSRCMFAFVELGLVSYGTRQGISWEERLQNDLFCVMWDVKLQSHIRVFLMSSWWWLTAGKLKDPEFDQYITPHSCGEVCGRQRDRHCPHRCNVLCHPGPCPPCQAFTTKSCACGKTRQTVKCASASTTRCDKACEKTRNCGKHSCLSVCHEASCDPCSETVSQVLKTTRGFALRPI